MIKTKIADYVLRIICLAAVAAGVIVWNNHQVEKRVKAECALQQAQTQIAVEDKKQEEIKNVQEQSAVIHSRPNAKRDSLLKAMRNGTL